MTAPTLPTSRKVPTTPTVFKGEIFSAVGKYARHAVLFAFEEMGGPQELAEWGRKNPGEFYTKILPKIIARESEVVHTRSVDDIMDLLDADYDVEDAQVMPVDAEPEVIMAADFPEHRTTQDFAALEDDDEWDPDAWNLDDYVDFPDETRP